MDWKHPIVVIIVAAVVIVGLYYLVSPYEKCLRKQYERYQVHEQYKVPLFCNKTTHW